MNKKGINIPLNSLWRLIFLGIFILQLSCHSTAQEAGAEAAQAAETSGASSIIDKTKNDLMLITFAGLGGAVLGLSTLSFVEQPEKKLKNIVTGGALGIIAGVLFVAYRQATETTGLIDEKEIKNFAPPVEDTGGGILLNQYREHSFESPTLYSHLAFNTAEIKANDIAFQYSFRF